MKNIILIITLIFAFCVVSAQDGSTLEKAKLYQNSMVANVKGDAIKDTVSLGYPKYFYFAANPFIENVKVRATVTKKTGYAKHRTIIQTSLDGITWVAKDTIAFATSTTATGLSDLINCKDKYARIIQAPYDSTGVAYYKYTILIEGGQ